MWHREPGAGRYAHPEREHRFLLPDLPPGLTGSVEIADRYLTGTRLRLRRVSDGDLSVFKLGQKVRLDADDPYDVMVTNIYLSADEYERLLVLPGLDVRKTRHRLESGGAVLTVDQFHGPLAGLVLAEAEADVAVPPFAVADVTHDDRFSGGRLAETDADTLQALLQSMAMGGGQGR